MGTFVAMGMNMALKAGGIEPMLQPNSVRIGVSISSSGKIELTLPGGPNTPPAAVFVTYEEFPAIAQKLKEKLLEGTIIPGSEDEIPRLVYQLAINREFCKQLMQTLVLFDINRK